MELSKFGRDVLESTVRFERRQAESLSLGQIDKQTVERLPVVIGHAAEKP